MGQGLPMLFPSQVARVCQILAKVPSNLPSELPSILKWLTLVIIVCLFGQKTDDIDVDVGVVPSRRRQPLPNIGRSFYDLCSN